MGEGTQLEYLWRDIAMAHEAFRGDRTPVRTLADATDADAQNLRHLLADLAVRVVDLAEGVALAVQHDLRASAMLVVRGLYESWVTTYYLKRHAQPEAEAVIYLAASYLEKINRHADDADAVQEWQAGLARMPVRLVSQARKRLSRKPRKWSGMGIAAMARAAGMSRHEDVYEVMCAEAHAAVPGDLIHIVWTSKGEATEAAITIKPGLRGREPEAMANLARRALRSCMVVAWEAMDGEPVRLDTPDPEVWRRNSAGPPPR